MLDESLLQVGVLGVAGDTLDLEVSQRQALEVDHLAGNASHAQRTIDQRLSIMFVHCQKHDFKKGGRRRNKKKREEERNSVLIDNVDDGAQLAFILTVVDQSNTADFNVSSERLCKEKEREKG